MTRRTEGRKIMTRSFRSDAKKLLARCLLLFLLAALLTPFAGCQKQKKPEDITWQILVEDGDRSFYYTKEDAEKHALSHMLVSMFVRFDMRNSFKNRTPNGSTGGRTTFRVDGITLAEFLEDAGRADAARVTYYGKLYDETDVTYTIEGEELLKGDRVMIAWIMNKENILPNFTKTYVGVFGADDLLDFVSCCSVERIVIE